MKRAGKRLVSTSIVRAAGLAVLPRFAHAAETPAADQPAEAAVRRASAREVKAFVVKDAGQLAGLCSDDMVVTYPLDKFVSKRRMLTMVQPGMLTFTAYGRVIEYSSVYGNMVILARHETVTWSSKTPHAGKTERLLFTSDWMKRGGHWQELARHAHMVPTAAV